MRVIRGLDRVLAGLDSAIAAVAAAAMLAIMLIVSSDVLMRYAFNRPWQWSYDLIDLYLTVALFYGSLPWTFRNGGHIRVDLLLGHVPAAGRRATECIVCALSAGLFLWIAFATSRRAVAQYIGGDVIQGAVAWPTWLSTGFAPIGSGLLAGRLLLNAVAHGTALLLGRDIIPLPALTDAAFTEGELAGR